MEKGYNIKDLESWLQHHLAKGMSVANHKKKDELNGNSLVVESMNSQRKSTEIFIFENVRAFLTSICTDIDGKDKPIKQAIDNNLSGEYNIHFEILNLKIMQSVKSNKNTCNWCP